MGLKSFGVTIQMKLFGSAFTWYYYLYLLAFYQMKLKTFLNGDFGHFGAFLHLNPGHLRLTTEELHMIVIDWLY